VKHIKSIAITMALALGALSIPAGIVAAAETKLPKVRLAINPLVYAHLPLMVAADKGYFTAEGVDAVIGKYPGSSNTQLPLVARGDLDMAPMVAGPALFNQQSQGFNVKVVAFEYTSKRGWNESVWLLVRKDVWDSGAVRSIEDLKGHSVDGGPVGTPVNVLLRQVLAKAHLSLTDVKFSERLVAPPDWLAAFRNKAVDGLTAVEPIASEIVRQGYGVKLVSPMDVAAWSPTATMVANPEFLQKNHDTVVHFLKAVLRADQDIVRGGPHWTPEITGILAHWSKMTKDQITTIPSPSYYGDYGKIDPKLLDEQQKFWVDLGQVKQPVDIATLIDASAIDEARKDVQIK